MHSLSDTLACEETRDSAHFLRRNDVQATPHKEIASAVQV
jgi:hypothetical protein